MKTKVAVLALLACMLAIPLSAQVVAAPQYAVTLNAFTGGIYGQTTAVDTNFGYQFTTNGQLAADLLTAPGGGVSDYLVGYSYGLCGLKAIENVLMNTKLDCSKFNPFASFTAGEGSVQQGGGPTQKGAAFMAKLGASLPSASGTYALAGVIAYGDFGPPIPGQSNKGFVGYLGFTLGGGNNEAATQEKILRKQRAEAKRQARFEAKQKAAQK
jgi:hypothetical protein